MLCHHYCIRLLPPCGNRYTFQISLSSVIVAHWKRKMGNSLLFARALINAASCKLHHRWNTVQFFFFLYCYKYRYQLISLKYHDIILRLYLPPLFGRSKNADDKCINTTLFLFVFLPSAATKKQLLFCVGYV